MLIQRILLFIACFLSVKSVSHFVDRGKIMTPEITVPYFSGAALHHSSEKWIFNLNEVDSIKKLSQIADPEIRRKAIDGFRFSNLRDSIHVYQLNQPGLLYAIILAKKIFFFEGDIGALKSFQLLIHTLFCFLILLSFKSRKKQALFFLLYFINPAIIYLTIFPFYYYWQVIGSYILVLILLNSNYQNFVTILFSSLLLACIYHIRISTLPLSLFIILFGFYKVPLMRRSIALLVFVFCVYLMEPEYLAKHPGHVMYSSLGAYPGSNVKGFSDNISFENYSSATGKKYSYESTPSMYDAEVIMGEAKWGMQEFILFAKGHPILITRNAILNVLGAFSFGYLTASLTLTYLSAFVGLAFLILLIVRKKYAHVIIILISSCSYILYLAPVPIYLYGTYLISMFAFIELIPERMKN